MTKMSEKCSFGKEILFIKWDFSLNVESEIQIFNVIFHRSQGGTAQKDESFSDPWHQFFALGSSNCCDEGWKNF